MLYRYIQQEHHHKQHITLIEVSLIPFIFEVRMAAIFYQLRPIFLYLWIHWLVNWVFCHRPKQMTLYENIGILRRTAFKLFLRSVSSKDQHQQCFTDFSFFEHYSNRCTVCGCQRKNILNGIKIAMCVVTHQYVTAYVSWGNFLETALQWDVLVREETDIDWTVQFKTRLFINA